MDDIFLWENPSRITLRPNIFFSSASLNKHTLGPQPILSKSFTDINKPEEMRRPGVDDIFIFFVLMDVRSEE